MWRAVAGPCVPYSPYLLYVLALMGLLYCSCQSESEAVGDYGFLEGHWTTASDPELSLDIVKACTVARVR